MTARIVGATLRDLSYVAANLRLEDAREVDCQFAAPSPAFLASIALRDHSYIVEIDGNPEAAFGAGKTFNPGLWTAWSWGSKRMWRAVPRITEFVRTVMIPDIIEHGGQRCEARAMACHTGAHRWLKRMGAEQDCVLEGYGKGGEDFILFSWTRKSLDVLQRSIQPAQTTEADTIADTSVS